MKTLQLFFGVAILFCTAQAAAQCPAGGYPPPPPPYAPEGVGLPVFAGPVAGGTTPNPLPQPPAGPEAGGGTTPGTSGGTTPGGAGPRVGGPGVPGGGGAGYGNRGSTGRRKRPATPWLDRIAVEWTPSFLPPQRSDEYDAGTVNVSTALTRNVSEGGWEREELPSLVLAYDPSSASQVKSLKSLERDLRFRVGASVFNCYKVDTRLLDKSQRGKLSLQVYDREGKRLAEFQGRSIRKAFDAMKSAYKAGMGRSLTKAIPNLQQNLSAIAYCEHQIEKLERAIVCPDCGKGHDTVKKIASLRKDQEMYRKALETFRKVETAKKKS